MEVVSNENKGQRKIYLDILNIIAIIAVVALHCNGIVWHYSNDTAWKTSLIVEVFCYWAVPVFLMITGANLLVYYKKYDLKTYFKKRMSKILIGFLFASILTISYRLITNSIDINMLSFENILETIMYHKYEGIYYYIFVIIGVYFTIPLIAPLSEEKNKKILNYAIIIIMIMNVLIPSLVQIFDFAYNHDLLVQVGGYIIYILLGYELSVCDLSKNKRMILYIVATLMTVFKYIYTLNESISIENYSNTLCGYANFFTVILAAAIFVFIKNINYKKIFNNISLTNIINKISSYSFYVYLIHMLIVDIQIRLLEINCYSWEWRTFGVVSTYLISLIIIHMYMVVYQKIKKYLLKKFKE